MHKSNVIQYETRAKNKLITLYRMNILYSSQSTQQITNKLYKSQNNLNIVIAKIKMYIYVIKERQNKKDSIKLR